MTNNSFALTFNATFQTQVASAPSESATVSESAVTTNTPASAFPLTFDQSFASTSISVDSEPLAVDESPAAVDGTAFVPVPNESVAVGEPTVTTSTPASAFPLTFDQPFASTSVSVDSAPLTVSEPAATRATAASAFSLTFDQPLGGGPTVETAGASLAVDESPVAVDGTAFVPVPNESVAVGEPTVTTSTPASAFPLVFDQPLGGNPTVETTGESAEIAEPTITADAPASVPAPSESLALTEPGATPAPAPSAPTIPAAETVLGESAAGLSGSPTQVTGLGSPSLALDESAAAVTPDEGNIGAPASRLTLGEPAVWLFGGAIPTLTRWLLKTVYREWPDGPRPPQPPDANAAVRIDRDDPEILATGERSRSFDLTVGATISAGIDDTSHTPEGTGPTYETEETATVRVTSLHERQGGTVDGHAEHRRLVDDVLLALDAARSYPEVVLANRAREPVRLSLFIGDVQHSSNTHADHFETTIPLRLRGKLDPY